jgi:Tfp pilus assembly protein PilF
VNKFLSLTLLLFLLLLAACGGGDAAAPDQDAAPAPSSGSTPSQLQPGETSPQLSGAEKAVQDLEASVQANPSLDGYFELGNAYSRQGQLSKARGAYENALKINPNHTGSLSNLGVVYYQTGEFDKAITQFKKVLSLDSQDAATHYLYGATLLQMSNYKEAEKQLGAALEIDPGLPEAHFGMGTLYWQTGRIDEAIAEFETFLAGPPAQDPQARTQAEQILKQLRAQQ